MLTTPAESSVEVCVVAAPAAVVVAEPVSGGALGGDHLDAPEAAAATAAVEAVEAAAATAAVVVVEVAAAEPTAAHNDAPKTH